MESRIPVRLGLPVDVSGVLLSPPPGELVVPWPSGGMHVAGCACCAGRHPLAIQLGAAFVARARGGAWFDRVVVIPPARLAAGDTAGDLGATLREVLQSDPVTAARFRADLEAGNDDPSYAALHNGFVFPSNPDRDKA